MSSQPRTDAPDSSKGRVVGFVALGALVLLVGIAFVSQRGGSSSETVDTKVDAVAASRQTNSTQPDEASVAQSTASGSTLGKDGVVSSVVNIVALSPEARMLSERYHCACGCTDMLATCTCDKAQGSHEMRHFLQALVHDGKNPLEIETAMVARFGEVALP